jgi:putative membrane protein
MIRCRWRSSLAIRHYTDHSANERTLLAWLRTGLAVIAFGLFVEKLNLLLPAVAGSIPPVGSSPSVVSGFLTRVLPYEGLAFSLIGVAMIGLGGIRFVRAAREIDRTEPSAARGSRAELGLTGGLALLAACFCVSLAFQTS